MNSTLVNQNHVSKCKNSLSDIFNTLCAVVNRSKCATLKQIISVPYFQKNVQGVRHNIDYTARNAMVYSIFEGLKGDSAFSITLEEWDLLKFLTDAYYKFLHPEEVDDKLVRALHRMLSDIKGTAWTNRSDEDGDIPMVERGAGW